MIIRSSVPDDTSSRYIGTTNSRVHGTTKRIPAEVFKEERETLRPLDQDIMLPETKILRTVRKDNTIIYTSNRYTVPFGRGVPLLGQHCIVP